MIDLLQKYFPNLTKSQIQKFSSLIELYSFWNEKINVISRKDFDNFYIHHVLHSLSICKIIKFKENTIIADIGTGGGFPGIPLAIFFPECKFFLIDSIAKKIKVVSEISKELKLNNVETIVGRAENINFKSHFIVSRAVTQLPKFLEITKGKLLSNSFNDFDNGYFYIKGGDFDEELKLINKNYKIFNINEFFDESFFETKKIVYIKN